MLQKLFITGPVGSGKSTLAREIARRMGIQCTELDSLCYVPDDSPSGNRKRPVEERDALFSAALAEPRWVMEDAGRACFEEARRRADAVVLLEPSPLRRRLRVVRRWLKQNLGLEPCGYRPGFEMLRSMFRWSKNYETGKDDIRQRLQAYPDKLVVLRTNAQVREFLAQWD